MNKQAQSIKALEDTLADTIPKVKAQADLINDLRGKLAAANSRVAAATKRHNETIEAQAAARDQNRIILRQYKEERDALRDQVAQLRGSSPGLPRPEAASAKTPWWYWREDPDRRHMHPAGWVMDDGFVAFPSALSSRIEAHHAEHKGTGTLTVSLAPPTVPTDRGTMLAPVEFEIDVGKKTQRNLKTGEVRPIARRGMPSGASPKLPPRQRANSAAAITLPRRSASATTPKSPGRASAPSIAVQMRVLSAESRARSFSDPPERRSDSQNGHRSARSPGPRSPGPRSPGARSPGARSPGALSPERAPSRTSIVSERSRSRILDGDDHFVTATNV